MTWLCYKSDKRDGLRFIEKNKIADQCGKEQVQLSLRLLSICYAEG